MAETPKAGPGPKEEEEWTGWRAWFLETAQAWAPAILAVIFIRLFIFEPFRIPSGSMVPTLLIGDHVLVTKFSYGVWLPWVNKELLDLGDPQRGDVIVFRYPKNEAQDYIKRVIAIPGDRVTVRNNQVFLDDVAQPQTEVDRYDFIDDKCHDYRMKRKVEVLDGLEHEVLTNVNGGGPNPNMPEREIPPGHVFVMGDNRDNSLDGRSWGLVRFDQIKGKAHFIWVSWDGCSGGFGQLRMDRFFRGLYSRPEVPSLVSPASAASPQPAPVQLPAPAALPAPAPEVTPEGTTPASPVPTPP